MLKYSGAGPATLETTGTKVIAKVNSVLDWEVDYSVLTTAEDLRLALIAAVTPDWVPELKDNACCPSRAFASWRNGACITIGTTAEPLAGGDPNTYGLATCLWYGMSIGEWSTMLYSGKIRMPVQLSEVVWRNNLIFGDPLYRPFGQLAQVQKYRTPNFVEAPLPTI